MNWKGYKMKLAIYHGTIKPFLAIGKHQCKLLEFAFNFPDWHYWDEKCNDTKRALLALNKKGVIIINEFNQFKINL